MKRHIFILTIGILLGSCSKTNEDISKVKEIEINKPPISSKDIVHHDDKENEAISNAISIVQVEEKIETSAENPKTTTYDESPSNQNKKPDNTIYKKRNLYKKN